MVVAEGHAMNDDFLYRIRTQPPPEFAFELKNRLDRAPRQRARIVHVGIGLLLFGTAFAVVTLTNWFSSTPEPEAREEVAASSAPTPSEGAFPPDSVFERDGVPVGPDGEIRETQSTRAPSTPTPAPISRPAPDPVATETIPAPPREARDPPSYQSLYSEFIVTGPLIASAGTAAQAFERRRAVFSMLEWAFKPSLQMLKRERPWDAQAVILSATRVERLAPMIDDAFLYDTRGSNVKTRALDNVWSEHDLFRDELLRMMRSVKQMKAAAQDNQREAAMIYTAGVAAACTRCHVGFRKNGDEGVGLTYP
jgi:cytochrome c556